jgi:hypothetical protein
MLQESYSMSRLPPDVRSRSHDRPTTDGGRGLLLGGPAEVRVCEPRCGPVHQAGDADARGARTGDGRARNRRRPSSHERPRHAAHQCAVRHRDARGDTVHQDFAVPGHLPAARATRPAGHGGGWAVLHEIRSEYAQIMTCIYLLAAGPGPWSLDALLLRRHRASAAEGSSAAFPSSALRADSGRRRPRKYGLGYRSTPLRQKSGHDPIGSDSRGRGQVNAGGGYGVRPTIY